MHGNGGAEHAAAHPLAVQGGGSIAPTFVQLELSRAPILDDIGRLKGGGVGLKSCEEKVTEKYFPNC